MRVLPSRGFCHAVYLLIRSAKFGPTSFENWLTQAKVLPAQVGASTDLRRVANLLVSAGLAVLCIDHVKVRQDLLGCGQSADRDTFLRIARIWLETMPPTWLTISRDLGQLTGGLMPEADRASLAWLEDDLAPILDSLIGIEQSQLGGEVAGLLGSIGEEIVLASERHQGFRVRRVSLIADGYGYDIEVVDGASKRRLEVKTTVESKTGIFFLTRNEFIKSTKLEAWFIVQILLKSEHAFSAPILTPESVASSHILSAGQLRPMVIADTEFCEWSGQVRLSLPASCWSPYKLSMPPDWSMINPLLQDESTA